MISKEEVKKIAHLARLESNETDVSNLQGHFNNVIQYFDSLQTVSTEGIAPMVTPHEIYSELRKDEVLRLLGVDEVLQNAPEIKNTLFKVPPVV